MNPEQPSENQTAVAHSTPITPDSPNPYAATPVSPVVNWSLLGNSTNPGKSLGLASLLTALFGIGPVALVTGAIGLFKSKKVGLGNSLAVAGIVIGALNTIFIWPFIIGFTIGTFDYDAKCAEFGPGTHLVGDTEYICE